MTDSSLRTAIARALFEAYGDTKSPGWDAEYPSMKRIYFDQADAVLKVLADPPFEVWERCVNRIDVDDMDQRNRETIANTVLRAVLETGEDDE